MSIETFMNCLEAPIEELCKGNEDMFFTDNKSHFIKFGKDKCDVIYRGVSTHSNLIGVSLTNHLPVI
jgi:hypothetical protein